MNLSKQLMFEITRPIEVFWNRLFMMFEDCLYFYMYRIEMRKYWDKSIFANNKLQCSPWTYGKLCKHDRTTLMPITKDIDTFLYCLINPNISSAKEMPIHPSSTRKHADPMASFGLDAIGIDHTLIHMQGYIYANSIQGICEQMEVYVKALLRDCPVICFQENSEINYALENITTLDSLIGELQKLYNAGIT